MVAREPKKEVGGSQGRKGASISLGGGGGRGQASTNVRLALDVTSATAGPACLCGFLRTSFGSFCEVGYCTSWAFSLKALYLLFFCTQEVSEVTLRSIVAYHKIELYLKTGRTDKCMNAMPLYLSCFSLSFIFSVVVELMRKRHFSGPIAAGAAGVEYQARTASLLVCFPIHTVEEAVLVGRVWIETTSFPIAEIAPAATRTST